MKEETATLAIYYNARGGDRSAFNDLKELAKKGGNQNKILAKSLLDDANLYFLDYKNSFQRQMIIDEKTRIHFRPAAEDLYKWIHNNEDPLFREASINEIATRKLKYFVEDLVKIVRDDSNLKVACCAAKALEILTGEHFEDYPPYDQIQSWWQRIGKKDKKYEYPLKQLNGLEGQVGTKDGDKAVATIEEILNSTDGMCITHANIAEAHMIMGDKDKAKRHFKIAGEQCDKQIYAMMRYATLLYSEGQKDEVIDILLKIKTWIKDESAFKKDCRSKFPNMVSDERFRKLLEGK
jgi:hypothetical protein